MRFILLSLGLALVSACDSSSDNTVRGNAQYAETELLPTYEDFGANFASDTRSGVFISQRVEGRQNAFLFVQGATPPLKRVNELLPAEAQDAAAEEPLAAISPSGEWIAVVRRTAEVYKLILTPKAGGASTELALDAPATSLSFPRDSNDFLAVVLSTGFSQRIKLIQVGGTAAAPTLTESSTIENEAQPKLLTVGGSLRLQSFTAVSNATTQTLKVRTWNGTSWDLTSDDSQSYGLVELQRPQFVSDAGVFSLQDANPLRSRNRQGPNVELQTPVAISDSIHQVDSFAQSLSFNFAAPSYLSQELVSLASLSGSSDGSVLVTTGLDILACTTGATALNSLKLVRRSDSKVVNIGVARKAAETTWSGVLTDICSAPDNTATGGVFAVDSRINKAQWLGLDGDKIALAIESTATFDREIRLVKFKLDWETGVVSEAEIFEVSANARPVL